MVCINGSHEELEYNRAADEILLSDPGAFLNELMKLEKNWDEWFVLQKNNRKKWVDDWYRHIDKESEKDRQKTIKCTHCSYH